MMLFFWREISELENFYLNDFRGSGIDSLLHLNIHSVKDENQASFIYFRGNRSKRICWTNKFKFGKVSRRLKMLQQFLWFVPLEFGAYFVGLTAALASFGSILHEWSFLQTAGMNQGNFGFLLIYFASSLLLLNGVRRVSLHSIADSFDQFPYKFSETLQTVQTLLNWKVWI